MKPDREKSNAISEQAIIALENIKGQDIVEVDLTGKADFADAMIVVSGTSVRQVKALADEVRIHLKSSLGEKPIGIEGEESAEWILVDYGCLIIHIMLPSTREFYELERLWTARPQDAESSDKSVS